MILTVMCTQMLFLLESYLLIQEAKQVKINFWSLINDYNNYINSDSNNYISSCMAWNGGQVLLQAASILWEKHLQLHKFILYAHIYLCSTKSKLGGCQHRSYIDFLFYEFYCQPLSITIYVQLRKDRNYIYWHYLYPTFITISRNDETANFKKRILLAHIYLILSYVVYFDRIC